MQFYAKCDRGFLLVKFNIIEVLRELNSEDLLISINFTCILKPIKLTVDAYSRKDVTRISADFALIYEAKT